MEDIPADCDYDLWLADQDGNALAYSSNYGDVDEAIVYIAEPGTYYAVIECYRRYKGDAPYSFIYDFEPLNLNSAEVIDERTMAVTAFIQRQATILKLSQI